MINENYGLRDGEVSTGVSRCNILFLFLFFIREEITKVHSMGQI